MATARQRNLRNPHRSQTMVCNLNTIVLCTTVHAHHSPCEYMHVHIYICMCVLYILTGCISRCVDMPKGCCIGQCGVCAMCATSKKFAPDTTTTTTIRKTTTTKRTTTTTTTSTVCVRTPRTNKLWSARNKFQINRWYLSLTATLRCRCPSELHNNYVHHRPRPRPFPSWPLSLPDWREPFYDPIEYLINLYYSAYGSDKWNYN